MQDLLRDVKKLCDAICGSELDAKSEIVSMAFMLGHHPDILNADNPTVEELEAEREERRRERADQDEEYRKRHYEKQGWKYVPR